MSIAEKISNLDKIRTGWYEQPEYLTPDESIEQMAATILFLSPTLKREGEWKIEIQAKHQVSCCGYFGAEDGTRYACFGSTTRYRDFGIFDVFREPDRNDW